MTAVAKAMTLSEVWSEVLAPKFVRHREVLIAGAGPHGRRALSLLGPAPGESAIDIGCGFGDATAELAELVGPQGSALGLDLVPWFVEIARQDTRGRGLAQLRFAVADAATYATAVPVDCLFARFGTMFFEQPLAAFRNLRRMLRLGGRMAMTTWCSPEENPWLSVAKQAALRVLPMPGRDAITCGPFSLSQPELIRDLLYGAGFREVGLERSASVTLLGRTLKQAVDFQMALGPAGEIVREAGAAGASRLQQVRDEIGQALSPYLCELGVAMPSAAWLISAH